MYFFEEDLNYVIKYIIRNLQGGLFKKANEMSRIKRGLRGD
tara:strand:+ start:536 stop:658 length:123 start_codon:yes stop_codon:yes gene_type:complete